MLREKSPEGIRGTKTDKKSPWKKLVNGKYKAKEENRMSMIATEDHVETAANRAIHRRTAAIMPYLRASGAQSKAVFKPVLGNRPRRECQT